MTACQAQMGEGGLGKLAPPYALGGELSPSPCLTSKHPPLAPSTCLEALKGLFWTTNYWEVFAYLKLQRGWELFEHLETYTEGVTLLARYATSLGGTWPQTTPLMGCPPTLHIGTLHFRPSEQGLWGEEGPPGRGWSPQGSWAGFLHLTGPWPTTTVRSRPSWGKQSSP